MPTARESRDGRARVSMTVGRRPWREFQRGSEAGRPGADDEHVRLDVSLFSLALAGAAHNEPIGSEGGTGVPQRT